MTDGLGTDDWGALSRAARDAAYNNTAACSGGPAYVEALSPLRLPAPDKPMALAYDTAELSALVDDSRRLHARRASLHRPGALLPVSHADYFTVIDALRAPDGPLLRLARSLLEA